METTLKLCFKGARDYLHGTDILNVTLEALAQDEITDIDFSFHRLARHQLKLLKGPPQPKEDPIAICAYRSRGARMKARLIETNMPVNCHYAYREDDVLRTMEIIRGKRAAALHGKTSYSEIEVAVAMTKALHIDTFPQLKGKWLFVRGSFYQYRHHIESVERSLIITASFNDKLTRSDFLVDGEKVGEIYFSII